MRVNPLEVGRRKKSGGKRMRSRFTRLRVLVDALERGVGANVQQVAHLVRLDLQHLDLHQKVRLVLVHVQVVEQVARHLPKQKREEHHTQHDR